MEVPFLDLKRQYNEIEREVQSGIARVMESQQFILGEEVGRFEEKVARYTGTEHAVGVASGTDALLLSLRALGIGHGDRVITTPFTFFATAGAIHNMGATPVFADIELDTYNIEPEKIEEILKKRGRDIKAIVPVHLYGQMADMGAIAEIAEDYGVKVIEDAAQAIGAKFRGVRAGNLGNTGCFSFFPTKNLGGAGDGGMVVTDNRELADKLRVLRVHGSRAKYHHKLVGYNSRLDAIQAAILSSKLDFLEGWSARREKNAVFYNSKLGSIEALQVPLSAEGRRHVYNQYTLRCQQRDELRDYLNDCGIGTAIYYPLPLHLQPCFSYLGYRRGDFPNAERATREVLSLPIFPELTGRERSYVAERVREFF